MSNGNSSQLGALLTAFVAGAIAGAGIALLYAPSSGQETREALARRSRELKDKVSGSLDDAKEMLYEKKAMIAEAFEAGKQAMSKKKSKESESA
ncbi:MAG: YtxH domain-containing protein [Victivallaceae bacterium]